MSNLSRIVLLYIAIVSAPALWASYTEPAPAEAGREHLLPGALLYLVTLPSSALVQPSFERWSSVFGHAAVQIGACVASGALQAALMHVILGRQRAKLDA